MEKQIEDYIVATLKENAAIVSQYPSAFARALVAFSPRFAAQVASAVNAQLK